MSLAEKKKELESQEKKKEAELKKDTAELEQQFLKLIEGQDTTVIFQSMMLVIHRQFGTDWFVKHLLGSRYR